MGSSINGVLEHEGTFILFYFIFIYLFILRFVLPTWLRGSYTIKANYLFIICLFNLLVSELSIYFLS